MSSFVQLTMNGALSVDKGDAAGVPDNHRRYNIECL